MTGIGRRPGRFLTRERPRLDDLLGFARLEWRAFVEATLLIREFADLIRIKYLQTVTPKVIRWELNGSWRSWVFEQCSNQRAGGMRA